MARLSKSLMTNEINKTNISTFIKLMPNFQLSKETENRLLLSIAKQSDLDKLLKLGSWQRRAFFTIKNNNISTNMAYSLYESCLYSIHHTIYSTDKDLWYILLSQETFNKNSFVYKKQEYKLFKFLLNKGWLTRETLDRINDKRKPNKQLFICISRNPIDFLFCSTNQNFSSCQSIDSGGIGLASLTLDPNRVLIFITDGTISSYNLCKQQLFHFKYIQRSWGLLMNNKTDGTFIAAVRAYPNEKIPFSILNNEKTFSIKTIEEKHFDCYHSNHKICKSVYEFEMPRFNNGCASMVYLDNIGLAFNPETKKYYYSTDFNTATGESCNNITTKEICNTVTNNKNRDVHICKGCIVCGSCLGTHVYTKHHYSSESYIVCNVCHKNIKLMRCKKCFGYHILNKEGLCIFCHEEKKGVE